MSHALRKWSNTRATHHQTSALVTAISLLAQGIRTVGDVCTAILLTVAVIADSLGRVLVAWANARYRRNKALPHRQSGQSSEHPQAAQSPQHWRRVA
jgi:hypothetical protein